MLEVAIKLSSLRTNFIGRSTIEMLSKEFESLTDELFSTQELSPSYFITRNQARGELSTSSIAHSYSVHVHKSVA
jgi:hypothetical protein